MKIFFISSILLLTFFSCKKGDTISPEETELIQNQTYNKTLLIDGHKYDNLIIENCVFEDIEGDGLQIRDVDNLIIRNCTFNNIDGNAIRFRNSGSSNNVLIENNEIFNIQENGILAYETHANASIIGNTIHSVGIDKTSSAGGAPHHGIYFQGKNFTIHQNKIYDIVNNNGNCISVRSYGKISSNILYNATKHGISYYSDHPGEDGHLLIENNFIYDNDSKGVNLNTDGNPNNHIGHATIRFNSIITNSIACVGIASNMDDINVEVYANILIRTDETINHIDFESPTTHFTNIEDSGDIGFINFAQRNLHIDTSSIARRFAEDITSFPSNDIDNEPRDGTTLDAGADEIE